MGTDTNFSKSGSSPGNVGSGFARLGSNPGLSAPPTFVPRPERHSSENSPLLNSLSPVEFEFCLGSSWVIPPRTVPLALFHWRNPPKVFVVQSELERVGPRWKWPKESFGNGRKWKHLLASWFTKLDDQGILGLHKRFIGWDDFPAPTSRTIGDSPWPPDTDFDLLFITAPERYSRLARVVTHELQVGRKDEEKDFTAFPPRGLHFADAPPRMLNTPRWRTVGGEKDRLPQRTEQVVRVYPWPRQSPDDLTDMRWWSGTPSKRAVVRSRTSRFYEIAELSRDWEVLADRELRLIDGLHGLKRHEVNPKFDGLPWAICDPRVNFAERIPPVKPLLFKSPKRLVIRRTFVLKSTSKHLVGLYWKHTVSNLRCEVCGAINGSKYPILSTGLRDSIRKKKCHVDSETRLCDRRICISTRKIKGEFDPTRLHVGYPEHSSYFPGGIFKTPPELMRWAKDDTHSLWDKNLDCNERYMYPKSKRKKAGKERYLTEEEGGTEPTKRPGTAEIHETVMLSPIGERIYQTKNNVEEKTWADFKNVLAGGKPEKFMAVPEPVIEIHKPNYNCFAATTKQSEKSDAAEIVPSWDPLDLDETQKTSADANEAIGLDGKWYWLIRAYIIQGTAPYRIPEYRDPDVKKVDEIIFESKLREAFEKWDFPKDFPEYARAPMKYISNPNRVGKEFLSTMRQTTGDEDEVYQQQRATLEKIAASTALTKSQQEKVRWIRDILDGVRTIDQAAKEQNRAIEAVRQDMSNFLKTKVEDLNPDRQWALALIGCKKKLVDGFYALVKLPRQTAKPYLLLKWEDCEISSREAIEYKLENALENAFCDVLQQRIKNKRVDGNCERCRSIPGEEYVCPQCEKRLLAVALEIHDEFNRLPWRARVAGEWYKESSQRLSGI